MRQKLRHGRVVLTCWHKECNVLKRNPDTYLVICKDQGKYVLATRRVFLTREGAEGYAATCNESRDAIVVPGDYMGLRFGHEWDTSIQPDDLT